MHNPFSNINHSNNSTSAQNTSDHGAGFSFIISQDDAWHFSLKKLILDTLGRVFEVEKIFDNRPLKHRYSLGSPLKGCNFVIL